MRSKGSNKFFVNKGSMGACGGGIFYQKKHENYQDKSKTTTRKKQNNKEKNRKTARKNKNEKLPGGKHKTRARVFHADP